MTLKVSVEFETSGFKPTTAIPLMAVRCSHQKQDEKVVNSIARQNVIAIVVNNFTRWVISP